MARAPALQTISWDTEPKTELQDIDIEDTLAPPNDTCMDGKTGLKQAERGRVVKYLFWLVDWLINKVIKGSIQGCESVWVTRFTSTKVPVAELRVIYDRFEPALFCSCSSSVLQTRTSIFAHFRGF